MFFPKSNNKIGDLTKRYILFRIVLMEKNTLKFVLLFTLFFVSCKSTNLSSHLNSVYVTNTKKVPVLPPECMQGELDALNLFTGSFNGETFSTPVYVQADESGLYLLLLNDFGVGMGELSFDGKEASLDSPLFPKELKAEYIILDFQNAYYDVNSLKSTYNASKIQFEQNFESDGTEIRRILNGSKLIEEIVIQNGKVVIENKLRGYTYTLVEVEE